MEVKIILYILGLIQILNYFYLKPKRNVLYCGLWCYVGNEPADPFKMKILAMYNLARGEHATGVCVNNVVAKSTKKATDFLKDNHKLLDVSTTADNFTILGHCRQATAHYDKLNVDFAHPHKINLHDNPFLYLVHNGTITNVDDLCQKYKLDYNSSKYSDSIQIAKIITTTWNTEEMEIFRDYEGSATLVFYPHSMPNTLFVHRDQMRELFYWQASENQTYISSVKEGLIVIGAEEADVKEFKHGILTEFVNGAIERTWDYSDKKPYSKPRTYSPVPARQLPKKEVKSKNGYYWENHLIHFNGHAYTGDFYMLGRSAVQFSNDPKATKYHCFYGVVVKDEESLTELKKKCYSSKLKNTDPKLFKKMTPLEISKFSLYPVAGCFGTSMTNLAFWTPLLFNAKEGFEHEWTPVLSNQTFKINNVGMILTSKYHNDLKTVKEFILEKIDQKLRCKSTYKTIGEFFSDCQDELKIAVNEDTYENFCDTLFDTLKDGKMLKESELKELHTAKWYETSQFNYHEYYNTRGFNELLLAALQRILEAPEEEFEETVEPTQDFLNDIAWYATPHFRNQILFGSFPDFDEIIASFAESDDPKYLRPLYVGIAQMFKDIGWIKGEEVLQAKENALPDVKFTLARLYNNLKSEQFFVDLMDSYSGSDKDVHELLRTIYWEIDALEKKTLVTEKEITSLKIYKLCLQYLLKGHKTINDTKLTEIYNLTRSELEKVCQDT